MGPGWTLAVHVNNFTEKTRDFLFSPCRGLFGERFLDTGRMEINQPAKFHVGNFPFLLPFAQPAQGWPAFRREKNFKKSSCVHQLDSRIDVCSGIAHARG
jgi:hypothetical protein